jgi:lipopolysaccharide cholinephosphotransferase
MKREESQQDNYSFNPEELKARFNPEGSMLRKQQRRMTEMLLVVDGICKKHGIRYWLCAGTLLGAVRHGGYIPWDDDLDIELMREDYLKLLKVMPQELPDDYALQTHESDANYFYAYAKLRDRRSHLEELNHYDRIFKEQGVFIDIFPMEQAPQPLRWISCRTLGFAYKVLNNPNYSDEVAARKVRRIYRVNEKFVFPVLRALGKLWPMGEKIRYSYGIPYNDIRLHSYLFPLGTCQFEGHEMPAPRDCDAYLKDKFGDYMRLPSMDELHPHVDKIIIDGE